MARHNGIGIGGVVSEIGWLGKWKTGIEKRVLVGGLRERFDATSEQADYAIKLAKEFNAVYEKGSKVYVNLD